MYCGRSIEQWVVAELRARLEALRLSKTGKKAELFDRLRTADPNGITEASTSSAAIMDKDGEEQAREEDRQDNAAGGSEVTQVVNPTVKASIQERELELMRRERDLIARELEVLRLENASLRNETRQRATGREVSAMMSESSRSLLQQSVTRLVATPLSQETSSNDVYWRWEKQFKLLCATYELDDRTARILVGARLKEQALKWFHSRPEYLEISVEELLEEMRKMFDHRPAKITLRRNFEKRVWQATELFSEYFHDKVTLANQVPVEEEEIVDYLIEGISDAYLRNQAKIQQFSTKEELLAAFERVRIDSEGKGRPHRGDHTKKETSDNTTGKEKSQPTKKIRCYNCSEFGHIGRDCRQAKREPGSCFDCGKADHQIKDCPQRAKKNTTKEKTRDTTREAPKTEAKQIRIIEEQIFRDLRYKLKSVELTLELTLRTCKCGSILKCIIDNQFAEKVLLKCKIIKGKGKCERYLTSPLRKIIGQECKKPVKVYCAEKADTGELIIPGDSEPTHLSGLEIIVQHYYTVINPSQSETTGIDNLGDGRRLSEKSATNQCREKESPDTTQSADVITTTLNK
ncbi:PREDICTED: uncharacterized protein LOC105463045 [Wasmannia auropunctata]|uniref:uncharacterized protein LOC105463045 n=1 Tax=Wasmannia auropunctata TaxID=64793 RepID=UPI0005F04840|nr:PREDICTED: uncharacterized protein LOC105463045 [Wasmannia auropunctata]